MDTFCGIVDFSSHTTDFQALVRMWRAMAPLSRGYSYVRGGVALVCERGKQISATRPAPHATTKRQNATVILSAPSKFPLLATELISSYLCGGLEAMACVKRDVAFSLVDEAENLLAIFPFDSPVFCARDNKKIIFSTSRDSLAEYSREICPFSLCHTVIDPHGKALFCDVIQN